LQAVAAPLVVVGLYCVRATDRPSDPLPEVTLPQQASRRTWPQL